MVHYLQEVFTMAKKKGIFSTVFGAVMKSIAASNAEKEKEQKAATQKKTATPPKAATQAPAEWNIEFGKDGLPNYIEKNGREWCDIGNAVQSPNGQYFVGEGYDSSGDDCLVLLSRTEGLRRKKCDEGMEKAAVTDDGVGYVFTTEGKLHEITASSTGVTAFNEYDDVYLDERRCIVATDCSDYATVKIRDFKNKTTVTKKFNYADEDEDGTWDFLKLEVNGDVAKLTLPDGKVVEVEI